MNHMPAQLPKLSAILYQDAEHGSAGTVCYWELGRKKQAGEVQDVSSVGRAFHATGSSNSRETGSVMKVSPCWPVCLRIRLLHLH